MPDPETQKIYLAGHRGMVGSAILRRLRARGAEAVLTRNSAELDLTDQAAVRAFFQAERPDAVILAAATSCAVYTLLYAGLCAWTRLVTVDDLRSLIGRNAA
jgi:nucleoside-diphosphate-sugar epimerase